MRGTAHLAWVGALVLALCFFYSIRLATEIRQSIAELSDHLKPQTARIEIVSETTPTTLTKALDDGTVISQTYQWDGTPEDAKRIREAWELYCQSWM